MLLNRIEISFLVNEISRAVKDLDYLITKINFSEPEENKTLDEIMNEIVTLQGNIVAGEASTQDIQIELSTNNSMDDMTQEYWDKFVTSAKIIIQNAPNVSSTNPIGIIPITLGSELYVKYTAYYYAIISAMQECEKVLVSKYNTTNDLKFVYYGFKQIAINTNVVNFAYDTIKDFEVDITEVFDSDTQHWNDEYDSIICSGIYSHSNEEIYTLLTESLQLLHKYCALVIKLSENGFEQFTGVAQMLNDACAATTSVMRSYDFVKINK